MTAVDPAGRRTADARGTPLLDVHELSVWFGAERRRYAVRSMSFQVAPGEAVGVVGESGSGKSMTMFAVLGLLPEAARTSGTVLFRGQDLQLLSGEGMRRHRGRDIGVVFQDPSSSLNPVLTIGRHLSEALRRRGDLDRRSIRARSVELLDLVGISSPAARLAQYPHELSGGMRQRVMIATAIAAEPALLIADEPTTALDVTVQAQVLHLLGELRRELGMAVVLVSHDLGVVAGFADRTIVMYSGEKVEEAETAALLADPKHPYTEALVRCVPRLDRSRTSPLEPIGGSPVDAGAHVDGCRFHTRCPHAFDTCTSEHPPLIAAGADRSAACWLLRKEAKRW